MAGAIDGSTHLNLKFVDVDIALDNCLVLYRKHILHEDVSCHCSPEIHILASETADKLEDAADAVEVVPATLGSGLVMAVIIGLHNIPEGMAVAVPLISGGMSRAKAVLLTAVTGAPTVIGALRTISTRDAKTAFRCSARCWASGWVCSAPWPCPSR